MFQIYLLVLFVTCSVFKNEAADVHLCSYAIRDTVFLLDGSRSIDKSDFELAKKFIIEMMTFLKTSNSENRNAFIVFGDDAQLVFNLTKYSALEEMVIEVNRVTNEGGMTAIGRGMELTWKEIFPTMRKEAEKMVILFTDGSNNLFPSPYSAADHLKDAFVQILTIGIGPDVKSKELSKIASPNLDIRIANFSNLGDKLDTITGRICPIPDPMPNVPCTVLVMDLVIVLDSSESISKTDYEAAKQFLSKVFVKYLYGRRESRAAMISFSDDTRLDFDFTNKPEIIYDILPTIKKFGSLTGIGKALKEVLIKLIPSKRDGIPFNILLLTDGQNNLYPRPTVISELLKKAGASIIAVGIGNDINLNELKALSSSDKALTVSSYDELHNNMKTVEKFITCG